MDCVRFALHEVSSLTDRLLLTVLLEHVGREINVVK